MAVVWGSLAGLLLYLEIIYHLCGFGLSGCQPIYVIWLIIAWSGLESILVGILPGRLKKIAYYFFLWLAIVWACVQYVYLTIFKQPLLWEAIFKGGGDALTNYWREALTGVVNAIPVLALMIFPGVIIGIVLHKKKWMFPKFGQLQMLRAGLILVVGIVGEIVTMVIGRSLETEYYEEYMEFYDPLSVAEGMGFLPMLQRDTYSGLIQLVDETFNDLDDMGLPVEGSAVVNDEFGFGSDEFMVDNTDNTRETAEEGTMEGQEHDGESESSESEGENGGAESLESGETQDMPVIAPQQFPIDYERLHSLADNTKQTWLADYIENLSPTKTNEYTGIFEGYNLIFLTAEGFSTYAIREDLTPTLYRLANSGFVFENYYVPIWQTSTSDGEYINCTGLIPDGQFSMRKSASNDMAYTLPRFFATEGVKSYAYHSNSLSYYDRYLTHPNLGYDFKCSKLGTLSEAEWGSQIFPMEHPNAWPASDLETMQGTVSEYASQERFHVYYMTISGHMNYNFKGNAMSYKNREAVSGFDLSESARAYLACNIELDKALEYLLAQLEEAGQLDKTVICLSADHYPYGLTDEQYEELAGKSLSEGMDKYRNTLILWNAGMEAEPVYVDKVCGSMDVLPTLLNLFGFSYDSRMYAGKDIFSDAEGMVIFNDRSFVTDSVTYKKKGKETIWRKNEDGKDVVVDDWKDEYLAAKQKDVKNRYQFSAYVLQENYYQDVQQAIIGSAEE